MDEPSTSDTALVPASNLLVMSVDGVGLPASSCCFTAAVSTDGFWLLPAGAILSHQRYTPNPTTAKINIVTTNFPRPVIKCFLLVLCLTYSAIFWRSVFSGVAGVGAAAASLCTIPIFFLYSWNNAAP